MQNFNSLQKLLRVAIALGTIILIATSVYADVPSLISYQGRLTDLDGNPIDSAVSVTFSVYSDASGGSPLWSETHPAVVPSDGLFNVLLGSVSPITSSLFDGSTRYLAMQLGAGPESTPRIPMVSVSYAFRAINADTAAYALASPGSGSSSGWVDDGANVRLETLADNVGIGTNSPSEKLDVEGNVRVGGTLSVGDEFLFDAAANKITSTGGIINFDSARIIMDGEVRIGGPGFSKKRLTVEYHGSNDTLPLWVLNQAGTAAGFYSQTTGAGYPSVPTAVHAFGGSSSIGGFFATTGSGAGIYAKTSGSADAVHGHALGVGYSGFFEGGMGVKVDGSLEATGSLKLPNGAANGYVLTSDASGTASWQAKESSLWTMYGGDVVLSDTSRHVSIGDTTSYTDYARLSVEIEGTALTSAMRVRNKTGTAARFYSGGPGITWSPTPSAVYGLGEGASAGGHFMAWEGSGDALIAGTNGSGYAGRFSGGAGVQINGALEVNGHVIISGRTIFGENHGAVDSFSTISGGYSNSAWGEYATVAGGASNSATGLKSAVGGGESNAATSLGSVIGGGIDNSNVGPKGTIGGGYLNRVVGSGATVGGGENNNAIGVNSVVSGGGSWNEADSNYAHGTASTVPGGRRNGALGDLSFAAGYRAKANHDGTFVWADDTESDFSSTQTDQFLIRATNGVGIGVNSPVGQLDVTDNADGIALHISNADRDIAWQTGQSLQFGDWNGVTFNPRMRINNNGNVGVNTTAPNGALHVRGNTDGMALHLSAASGDISWPTNNTLNMGTWDGATFNEHLRITAGGNVGIGVSSTPNILTIQQYSSTDPIADSWGTYSSRRWKTNIRTLEGALDRVLRLRGVTYNWKETGEPDIGLIAEEVGQVVPEIVHYEDNRVDAQSVDYARLVAVLIEAVKEQERTIQEQSKSIEELKSLVAEIQHASEKPGSSAAVVSTGE